ncbi:MAG: PKD domain-containing protein [Verrucomicrobiae bacterium]|nr:PKD domain-containing protein [Verrucomicrobiae bacterium]
MKTIRSIARPHTASFRLVCAFTLWVIGLMAVPASAGVVTLMVVDQHGQEIPGSQINVLSQTVNTGDSLLLPEGTQHFLVLPGLRSAPSTTTELYRTEAYEVTGATTEIVFEWITSTYTVRITDQHGVDIPVSRYATTGPSTYINAGDLVTLPITDESVYPTLNGGYRDGYFVSLFPGLRGAPSTSTELYRYAEGPFELSAEPAEFVFEWITSSYTVRLTDQHGVDIPASTFYATGMSPTTLNVGDSVTLPITDESVYPKMAGFYKDGYYTVVAPGLNGNPGSGTFLGRLEYNLELGTAPAQFTFEWTQHQCPLEIRDAANAPVPGSNLVLPPYLPGFAPGQSVTIPVNDVATYPLIGGYYASSNYGYWITVTPGDIAPTSDTIYLTLSAAGEFTPSSFSIGGNAYSLALACDDGCEPLAVASLTAPAAPLALGTAATVTAHFAADNGFGRICSFAWGDGTLDPGLDASATTVAASHIYASPGVYRVTVTAENACGDVDIAVHEFVVIYDPEGGFVTGGGWITSPAGAYAANPALTGKANFGFVAKYQQGANVPTGNTEFQFKAGNLNFKSTSYDWLVVAGAKAKFKGSGKINGVGDYAFQLTATDGQANDGGGTDKFRIKITSKSGGGVIYDNQPGDSDTADANTALGGGSIVVHKP